MRRAWSMLVLALTLLLVLTASLSAGAASTPKETALAAIERNKDEIAKLGDSVFSFAEVGMQEFETAKLCAEVLTKMGYRVETGIAGFPTAIMASYGSGKPVIAVHFEYDAVPSGSQVAGATEHKPIVEGGPGHAEGHNAGAAVAIGGAFAIKEAIDKHNLPGTFRIYTAPAEEQLVSRPYFVRDGYFKDVDAAFHTHVGDSLATGYGIRQYGMMSVEYEFFGKTAHSGTSPWLGNSAVDAAKLMDLGWDVLREHLAPTQRSHSVIPNGGIQPNVVPDYAKLWFFFRESNYQGVDNLYQKARKVAEGAALMTGCTWKENVMAAVWPTRDNKTMAEIIYANIQAIGMPTWTEEEQALAKRIQRAGEVPETGLNTKIGALREASQGTSSNDSGDITWTVPHGRITFPSNVPGVASHHWADAIAEATSIAHKGEVAGAKLLAASVVDLLTQPELLAKAKETFVKEVAGYNYRPLLPPDQKPPVDLNREYMAKYRPLMEPFYLRVPIEFR